MTMTHELRKLAEAATPGPWLYRPDNIDDWGWVRTSHEEDGFKPLVAEALRGSMKDNSDFDEHRRNKTDPYYHNAAYIAAANPKTILELLDRIAELEGAEQRGYDAAKEQAANTAENTYDHSWFLGQDPVKSPYRMHIAAAIRAMVRP